MRNTLGEALPVKPVKPVKPMPKKASERGKTLTDWMQDDESDPMPTTPPPDTLPTPEKRKMTREEIIDKMKQAGQAIPKNFSSGGSVSSAARRGDGCAQKGRTKGRFV